MYSLLAYVRKIQVFAKSHLFANIMITITCFSCIGYGIKNIVVAGNGFADPAVKFINL